MKMPFGRFKGVELADLPDEYLAWLRGLDDLREPLRSFIEAEWATRTAVPTSVEPLDPDVHAMVEELITAGFRAVAQRHHPDHAGGETKTMQLVNAAAGWLRRQARRSA